MIRLEANQSFNGEVVHLIVDLLVMHVAEQDQAGVRITFLKRQIGNPTRPIVMLRDYVGGLSNE